MEELFSQATIAPNTLWIVSFVAVIVLAVGIKIAIKAPLLVKWAVPLIELPGPSKAKWSRWWLWSQLSSGNVEEAFAKVNKTYGSVACIGPNHVITDDPKIFKRMLVKDSLYKKGPWFDTLKTNPHHGNLVSERDPAKHLKLRKIFHTGIIDYGLTDIEKVMDQHATRWILDITTRFLSTSESTKPMDLSRQVSFLALDIMTQVTLGRSFDSVRLDKDEHGFLDMVRSNMALQQFMTVFLECTTALFHLAKLPLLGPLLSPTANDGSEVGEVMGIMNKYIFEKSDVPRDPEEQLKKSLIGRCILRGLPREEADEQGLVLLAAGIDTTSTAIQSVLLAFILDVRVYNKVQDEIEICRARGAASRPIQFREAMKLPFLRACIQEGLRINPLLFQLRERVVPPEGDYIGGYRVPKGTYVGINTMSMLRNEVFGDDTDAFRPERWLVEDEAQVKKMTQTLELGFGYGPNKCLGAQIAMMEIHKVVFELLRTFDIAVLKPAKPWKRTSFGVFYQEDFLVRVTHKETSDGHFSV